MISLRLIGLMAFGLLFMSPRVWTQQMHVVQHEPTVRAVIQGPGTDFFVHFDQPVDHIHSCLIIGHDGKVVELLNPRLEAQPDVLFARMPTLPPGDYKLYWTIPTKDGATVAQGGIPFSVKQKAGAAVGSPAGN
jgi:methionine-rich copper-binding protein CopC